MAESGEDLACGNNTFRSGDWEAITMGVALSTLKAGKSLKLSTIAFLFTFTLEPQVVEQLTPIISSQGDVRAATV